MRKTISIILVLALALSLVACGKTKKDNSFYLYYLNTDKCGITPVEFSKEFKRDDDPAYKILYIMEKLSKKTNSVDYMATIPAGLKFEKVEYLSETGNATLLFSGDEELLADLEDYTRVLIRAAVVKTLVQIDGVNEVSIYVNNEPLRDTSGEIIGPMTSEDFIDNFDEQQEAYLSKEVTLYFANTDGSSLCGVTKKINYSQNTTLERRVLQELLKGPGQDNAQFISAIPEGTMVKSFHVENGLCTVNFDATLETGVSGVTESAEVYSIVNTLTELPSIKQVLILVNGETPHLSNLDVDLSAAVNRNEDIIYVDTGDEDMGLYKDDGVDEDSAASEDESDDDWTYIEEDSDY